MFCYIYMREYMLPHPSLLNAYCGMVHTSTGTSYDTCLLALRFSYVSFLMLICIGLLSKEHVDEYFIGHRTDTILCMHLFKLLLPRICIFAQIPRERILKMTGVKSIFVASVVQSYYIFSIRRRYEDQSLTDGIRSLCLLSHTNAHP